MGGEFSFDDYLMERDPEEFTPSEIEAIHEALRREEAACAAAERGPVLATDAEIRACTRRGDEQ